MQTAVIVIPCDECPPSCFSCLDALEECATDYIVDLGDSCGLSFVKIADFYGVSISETTCDLNPTIRLLKKLVLNDTLYFDEDSCDYWDAVAFKNVLSASPQLSLGFSDISAGSCNIGGSAVVWQPILDGFGVLQSFTVAFSGVELFEEQWLEGEEWNTILTHNRRAGICSPVAKSMMRVEISRDGDSAAHIEVSIQLPT